MQGYDREVVYRYVPVGAAATFPFSRTFLTISSQYNWLVDGHVESKLGDIDPELMNITVDLDGGSGYDFSAMVNIPAGRHRVSIGPFVREWSIDQSKSFVIEDPENSGDAIEFFEPGNRTREAGLRVTFAF